MKILSSLLVSAFLLSNQAFAARFDVTCSSADQSVYLTRDVIKIAGKTSSHADTNEVINVGSVGEIVEITALDANKKPTKTKLKVETIRALDSKSSDRPCAEVSDTWFQVNYKLINGPAKVSKEGLLICLSHIVLPSC
jgi:hypothetical protein